LLDGEFCNFLEGAVGVVLVDVKHEFGDDLCVRLRLEGEALLDQEQFNVLVVGDDAVVHQAERVLLVGALRVSVQRVRDAVRCPTCVSDANVAVGDAVKVQLGLHCKTQSHLVKSSKLNP